MIAHQVLCAVSEIRQGLKCEGASSQNCFLCIMSVAHGTVSKPLQCAFAAHLFHRSQVCTMLEQGKHSLSESTRAATNKRDSAHFWRE